MLDDLIRVLEISVEKNWEKQLTNKWLLNICKVANKKETMTEFEWYEMQRNDNVWKN
jgi:hypothetical protein